MYIDIFIIACIVFLVFESGFMDSLRNGLAYILKTKPEYIRTRPIFCRTCETFWWSLGYLLYTNQFNLFSLCYILIFANMTDIIEEVFYTIKENIMRILKMFQS